MNEPPPESQVMELSLMDVNSVAKIEPNISLSREYSRKLKVGDEF